MILINSSKGERIFNQIKNQLHLEEHTWEDAFSSNKSFKNPWEKPKRYSDFWKIYSEKGFDETVKEFYVEDAALAEENDKLRGARKRAYAFIIPYPLWIVLRKIKSLLRRKEI